MISIQLPPLRDRKDDIPLLVQPFLRKYGEENRKVDLELTPDALDLLTEIDKQSKSGVGDAAENVERFILAMAPAVASR